MADPESSSTAQTQRQPSPAVFDPAITSSQCTGVSNLPASVVDAINKSSDLVPALFAIPCDSVDAKKLKLCKRVGWLRDGVFTTGYVEVNMKEARQKELFSIPRQVTIVKDDSQFQSVSFAAGSGKPTCQQLSDAMLRHNPSSTAVIKVIGDAIPNTITIGKDSVLTVDTPGKLVALKTQGSEQDERSTSPNTIGDAQEKDESRERRFQSLETNKTIVDATDVENNNTYTPSSTMEQNIEPVTNEGNELPAADYVLTEDGAASPVKEKSEPTFAPHVADIPDTPASRTLQNLMHIAEANRNSQDSKNGCPEVSSKKQSNLPEQETQGNSQSVELSEKALKISSGPSRNVSTAPETKLLTETCEPKLDVFKLSGDLSFDDIKERVMLSDAEKASEQNPSVQTASIQPTPTPDRTQLTHRKSPDPQIKTHPENLAECETDVDTHTHKTCSETCKPSLIHVAAEDGQDTGASNDTLVETMDSDVTMSADEMSIDVQVPKVNDSTSTDASELHPKTELHAQNSESNDKSERKTTPGPPTVCQQETEISSPDPSSASTRHKGTPVAESQSQDKSDEYPALKIGSVYSLSEKEAKELFPNLNSPQPGQPVQISQEPVDDHTAAEVTNPPLATEKEPSGVLDNLPSAETHIPSHSSEKSTFPPRQENADCQFPTNVSKVKLYNITPVKGSSGITDRILTPVTTINPVIRVVQGLGGSRIVFHVSPQGRPDIKKGIPTLIPRTILPTSNLNQPSATPHMPDHILDGPIAVGNRPSITVAPVQGTSGPLRLVHSGLVNSTTSPNTPGDSFTPMAPATMRLPVTTQIPGRTIRIIRTGGNKNVRNEATSGVRAASTTNICPVSCTNQSTSTQATSVSNITVIRPSASTHTVTAAPKLSSGPIITNVPPGSSGNSVVTKSHSVTAVKVKRLTNVCPVASTNQNTSTQATTVIKITPAKSWTSINTVTAPLELSSGPIIASVPPVSSGSSAVTKPIIATKTAEVSCPSSKDASLSKETTLRLAINENQYVDSKASVSAPRKTFLITTSGGEKRLVSLPENAGAAVILSNMASKKAYKLVIPQKSENPQPEETKVHVKQELNTDADTQTESQRPITPETLTPVFVHKHKKHKKKKKSHMKSDEEGDIRRSSRERKQKRPYSPLGSPPKDSKLARGESPTQASHTGAPRTQDIPMPFIKTEPQDFPMPVIKTEPQSPEPYSGELVHMDEDQLQSHLQPLKSPPPYVDRWDRVRRLKELKKEKERALEEMRQRRKKQLEERLADPQLCDL